jgi:hypothetical protein
MKKFWIEWLDGSLIGEVEAESERQARNICENHATGWGLEPGTYQLREKPE